MSGAGEVGRDGPRLRGPLLLPVRGEGGRWVDDQWAWCADGAVVVGGDGVVAYAGEFAGRPAGLEEGSFERTGLLIPPLVDCHIHVPQWPIRGRFVEGVTSDSAGGALLAGLARNVYPAEGRCADVEHAMEVSRQFLADTRANGTVGGVAYMTSHPVAARAALQVLPGGWRVGLVMMDQNCPPALAISAGEATTALEGLVRDFGQRVVVTDRFAVACSTRLRAAGVAVARRHGLDTQTHLAEQLAEIETVAKLYPESTDYTDVYDRDGLLGCGTIVAHCIHLSEREWRRLAEAGGGARVAHCPISNTLLGSGVMPLEQVYRHGLDWALCTDVGASPSTSLLVEATHFLGVHEGRSSRATPSCALWRATVGAKRVGRVDVGGITAGERFAAVELAAPPAGATADGPDEVIRAWALGPVGAEVAEVAEVAEIEVALRGRVRRVWGEE